MDDDVALHMTALQRNMAKELLGPGDVEHTRCVPSPLFACFCLAGPR